MSSSNQNNATESYQPGEPSFDVNTIVVLAALLCALVAALTVDSVIQYALRQRRESQEAAAGSEKHTMKKIPVEVFRSGVDIPATECSICLGEFVDGEKVRVLPECNHEFHVKCVDKWLVDHMSCPNCRQLVALPREGVKYEGEYDHHRVVFDFMV